MLVELEYCHEVQQDTGAHKVQGKAMGCRIMAVLHCVLPDMKGT
jgi:predicted metal-dependent hydrolase